MSDGVREGIVERLARIEAKVDLIYTGLNDELDRVRGTIHKLEGRVHSYLVLTIVSLLGIVTAFLTK